MGGGVDAARDGRRVAGRPAGRGDLEGLRPAGQRDAGGHVRLPARCSRPVLSGTVPSGTVSPGAGTSTRRPSSEDRIASSASWTPLAPGEQVPRERPAARGGPQEQLPLRLEPVAHVHVVRHVGPHRLVVERVGQVGVPYRHRGGHLVLDGAVAQARDRAAVRAVHLQLEQLAAVDADRPRGVHRRDDAAGELEHRVGGVVRGHVVGLARLVPPPGQVGRTPRVDRADRAEQVLKQVLPVREHVEDDAAAVFRAVVPRGALRREPVAFEHPVAELEPDRQHPAEEALADQPAQLDHAGQEQLVLDDAVRDARRPRGLGQGEGGGGRGGHGLFRVDVLARRDGAGHGALPGAGDLGVEVDVDVGVAEHLVQARGPPGKAVPLGDRAQPLLAAADEDRLRVESGAVAERYPALLADGEQRPHEVLPVSHPAGDPVQGDVNDLARHGAAFRGVRVGSFGSCLGKGFPENRLGGTAGQGDEASDEEVRWRTYVPTGSA